MFLMGWIRNSRNVRKIGPCQKYMKIQFFVCVGGGGGGSEGYEEKVLMRRLVFVLCVGSFI